MELSNWAPEHSDALRELIAKGMSFSEAAQAINSRFNTSYTRSAALGRARRLRLEADDRQKPSLPTKPVDLHDIAEPRPSASRGGAPPVPDAGVQRAKADQATLCGDRTAASRPDRAGARRLPLPLRRR